MKVTFLTFSLTGNTEYVANHIGKVLEKAGYTVKHINIAKVVRAMHLISRDRALSKIPPPTGKEKEYLDMVNEVSSTDILGLGCFVDCHIPPPGVAEIIQKEWLPDATLSNVKYVFTYTTHGGVPHHCGDVLATELMKRVPKAIYCGHINVRVPENFCTLLPIKPYMDAWDKAQIEIMEKGAADLEQFISKAISSSTPVTPVAYQNIPIDTSIYPQIFDYSGPPACDKTKCAKCGSCAKNCPYGAITMSPDIEDGYPVFHPELCYLCCNCYNHCPKEAVYFPKMKRHDITRHPKPTIEIEEEEKKNGGKRGLIFRTIPTPDVIFRRSAGDFNQ